MNKGALAPKVDVRDYKVAAAASEYPESYQISPLPKVKNQGSVSSCVAHTASEILEHFNEVETGEYIPLSTDFIYGMQGVQYNRLESGMYLRDACKIIKEYGDCLKDTISTNTEQPKCTENLKEILTDEIYAEAAISKVKSYASCPNDKSIKHALMNYGPVMGSTKWYDKKSFDGKVIKFDKASDYGYHAIMIYGWCPQGWLCQNSWGKNWNGDGRFILPFGEVREAWSFVDATNSDIITPKRNSIFDIIYKIINAIINLFKK